nr:hypothetical protein [Lachnospiraceae bacterium]
NVHTLQAEHMYNAFKKAGQNAKLILHQDGHNFIFGKMIGDDLFEELMNRWRCHYLYDEDNGIEDMPELSVQSNVDGKYAFFDTIPDTTTLIPDTDASGDEPEIFSSDLDRFYEKYVHDTRVVDRYYLEQDDMYAKVYDLETGSDEPFTFIGSPEIHVKLKTPDISKQDLMVTAVLLDTQKDNGIFKAYITGNDLSGCLPEKTIECFEYGPGHAPGTITEYIPSPTDVKAISYGWTNLLTPDRGKHASEYTEKTDIEADEYYTYNIYLQPTVYTVNPGHSLKLAILAQDPQRVLMDEDASDVTPYFVDGYQDPGYSFTLDEDSLEVRLNVIGD